MNGTANNNHQVDEKQQAKEMVDGLVNKVSNDTENAYITVIIFENQMRKGQTAGL